MHGPPYQDLRVMHAACVNFSNPPQIRSCLMVPRRTLRAKFAGFVTRRAIFNSIPECDHHSQTRQNSVRLAPCSLGPVRGSEISWAWSKLIPTFMPLSAAKVRKETDQQWGSWTFDLEQWSKRKGNWPNLLGGVGKGPQYRKQGEPISELS